MFGRILIAKAVLTFAGCALAACARQGTAPPPPTPASVPAEPFMHQAPLGAPPGEPVSLAAVIANPLEGQAAAVAQGKQLFGQMNCVYCHAPGGAGLIGPPLDRHAWRYGGTPAQIFNSIHDGRPQGMPAWGARLPPQEIWKLVAYIESLGGAYPPATAAMTGFATPQPSATGPEPADQSPTDSAQAALIAEQHAPATAAPQ